MTREEAVEIVKKLYNDSLFLRKDKEALEVLIPELRESEDERIRKALIPVVDRLLGTINFPFTEEQVLNWFEKQKEQKPAEWSDEDEEILEHFLGWLQGTMGEKTYSSWLKSLPERFSLQPKREWSEEDEALFGLLHQYVCRCINDDRMIYSERERISKTMFPFIKKLQALHPQPKQEWSEEDEKMNKEIRLYLKQDRTDFPGRAERINKMIEWLINICPNSQWKPSEEQMEALLGAKGVLRNLQYNDWAKILEELYEQLKRL